MYATNEEYRNEFRKLCGMNTTNYPVECDDPTIDVESRDEMMYDEEAVKQFMDNVYEKTRNSPLFMKLYEKAAGFMFSTDPEIGMTILLGYDYLDAFSPCIESFLKEPATFGETNLQYQELVKRLNR
tara:strand:- start:770 stop:1150 length:381 start_codon:yes stop_codon:yes gene_type:complete